MYASQKFLLSLLQYLFDYSSSRVTESNSDFRAIGL